MGQILPPGATPTRLVTSTATIPIIFTEGPLADGTGGVFFSDMHASNGSNGSSRIIRYDIASGVASVPITNSGGTNGTYRAANGDIIAAERENRDIGKRTEVNGVLSTTTTSIVSTYNGTKFNGPNDVTVDSSGGIYFTDPDYEGRHSLTDAFYYYSAGGVLTQLGTFGTGRPNGIVLSPDGSTLYLALEQQFKIMEYDVTSPGLLANARTFVTTATQETTGRMALRLMRWEMFMRRCTARSRPGVPREHRCSLYRCPRFQARSKIRRTWSLAARTARRYLLRPANRCMGFI